MVLGCPKMVLIQLNKSIKTLLSDATRCSLPASLYIGPLSIRVQGCGSYHSTLTSPLSSNVATTYQIQKWHNTINLTNQTIKRIQGFFCTV